jgi:peptidoglycan-associated lipoprotein
VKEQPKAAVEDRTAQGADAKSAGQQSVSANPLTDPKNILSKRSVYFDLDKYDVKAEYKPMVEAHAKYLTGNKGAKVAVQGNTDERGSREYNIALGNNRADSVRKMMNVFGASDSQIEVISFGEDKPRAACHDESCWKENRRADIVYQGE